MRKSDLGDRNLNQTTFLDDILGTDGYGGFLAAILHIDHLGDEDAGIADDQAAGFRDDLAVQPLELVLDDLGIGVRQGRRRVPPRRGCRH